MQPQPKGYNSYHQSHKIDRIPKAESNPHPSIWDHKWPYWVIAVLIPIAVSLLNKFIG